MDEGSGTALARKLGIGDDSVVALVGAPDGFSLDLPPGVTVKQRVRGHADVVVAFFTSATDLERRLEALGSVVFPDGGLWIAWPKRSSGVGSDITDQTVRDAALPRGLVDNKVCSVDATWSALRVVWRRENRARRE
ncbi:MAG: DUF3052 domain-containing protein [Acidimicrobiales bacterium]